jgi:kynurenine formamidase
MAIAPSTTQGDEPPRRSFQRVVDLTHTLSAGFPMTWPNPFALEQVSTLGKDQWNAYRWHLQEHSGTHLDAPLHCTHGPSGDRIPADQLVGPLVVVDLRARAAAHADTQLTPEDLKAWERQHGPIAAGAVVALLSGWDARVGDARKFFGLDDKGVYHFPGFHVEAVQFLHERRDVKGIATDTLSLDPGVSTDFPVHHYWLGRLKWGLENVANLGQIPASGATIVVGSPKIAGCTGGPSRVLALV